MKEIHEFPESLNTFNEMESNDVTSTDLYKTLSYQNEGEGLKEYCNNFKNIYYINCFSFNIDDRKEYPGIYAVLQRYAHTANGQPLELVIGEYTDECIARARKATEEYIQQLEAKGIKIDFRDPFKYQHFIGYYGGSAGRTCQEVIRELKQYCPDKIKKITIEK